MRYFSKAYLAELSRLVVHTGDRGEGCNKLKSEYIDLLINRHLKLADVGGYSGSPVMMPIGMLNSSKTIELQYCYMRDVPGVTTRIKEEVLSHSGKKVVRIRRVDQPQSLPVELLRGISILHMVRCKWPEQAIAFRLRQEGSEYRSDWKPEWFDYYGWCFTMVDSNVDHLHSERFVRRQRTIKVRQERLVARGLMPKRNRSAILDGQVRRVSIN